MASENLEGDPRSKNARAQARHRAKRKAYVEQLESTVQSLRAALHVNGSSSAIAKIQYLESENARLKRESHALRLQLQEIGRRDSIHLASTSSAPSSSQYLDHSREQVPLSAQSRRPSAGYPSTSTNSFLNPSPSSPYGVKPYEYPIARHNRHTSLSVVNNPGASMLGDGYDSEGLSTNPATSRSSTASSQREPSPNSPYYPQNTTYPPLSSTSGAYVYGTSMPPYSNNNTSR